MTFIKQHTAHISRIASIFATMLLMLYAIPLTSCHKRLKPTTIEIENRVRHYPPVTLGDDLDMTFMVRNTGKETLVLTDVQPSCPTIEASEANVKMIPAGEEVPLMFTFHSDKNMGLARHSIRLFGNIAPSGVAEIVFDTHVVRPSIDMSDYEEYFQKNLQSPVKRHLDKKNSTDRYNTDQK